MTKNSIILVPARMASTRLPGKPLADIAGRPMIVHVLERAAAAHVGEVYAACSEQEVADAVEEAGFRAIMTDPNLPSGTDRIHAALTQIDPQKHYTTVVNVQGDLPLLNPAYVSQVAHLLESGADIGTLAAPITLEEERTNPNVVKAVIAVNGRALYFSRSTVPYGEGVHYHHIGLYSYTRESLERFVTLPPSPLEQREKLEQLRALENGLSIAVGIVQEIPLGVDTPHDLEKIRGKLTVKL